MGTNNIMSKAQCNDLSNNKSVAQNAQFNFLISEAQRNFCNDLFDSVNRNSIAERHFRTKLKRNLTSTIEISQRNAKYRIFAILHGKR